MWETDFGDANRYCTRANFVNKRKEKLIVIFVAAIRFELGDHHTYEFVEGVIPCSIDPGN